MLYYQEQIVPNNRETAEEGDDNQLTVNTQYVPTDTQKIESYKRALDQNDINSLEIEPQKKLCRYYYLDTCMSAGECSLMHSDFPCKFYYFGYECKDGKNCKLMHGSALNADMKWALWHHVVTAPANLLQRFPCFPHILLKKNFDDRHNELVQMEQEGLLEDNMKPRTSALTYTNEDTMLADVVQSSPDMKAKDLTSKQAKSLFSIGLDAMDKLLQVDDSLLLKTGFDCEALTKYNKEFQLRNSIYMVKVNEKNQDLSVRNSPPIALFDDISKPLSTPVHQPVLSDNELLSILNEDFNDLQEPDFETSESVNSSRRLDFQCKETTENNNSNCNHDLAELVQQNSGGDHSRRCALKTFRSDLGRECENLILRSLILDKEHPKKEHNVIQRTVEQLNIIDSLRLEQKKQYNSFASNDSYISMDRSSKYNSTVVDSINQSFGRDSNSKLCIRMPFKSIINCYTPATEIEASNRTFPNTQYKLIKVDVPTPNFECIRRSFTTTPEYSLDPRIRIMFNVGYNNVINRDPRLKKEAAVRNDDLS